MPRLPGRPPGQWDGAVFSRFDVGAILKGVLGHDGSVTGLTLDRFLWEAGLAGGSKAIWRATRVLEDAGLFAPDVKWDWETLKPLQGSKENDGEDGTMAFYARAIREAEGAEKKEALHRARRASIERWHERHPVSPWYPDLPGAALGGPRLWRSRALTVGGRGIRRTRKDVDPSDRIRRSPAWLVRHPLRWGETRLLVPLRGSLVVEVQVRVLPPAPSDLPPPEDPDLPPESFKRNRRHFWGEVWLGRLVAFDEALRDLRVTLRGVDSAEAAEVGVRAWLDGAPEDLPLRAEVRLVRFVEDSVTTYRCLYGLEDLAAWRQGALAAENRPAERPSGPGRRGNPPTGAGA